MRIVVVTHYMPPHLGGIELVAESLVEGLRARGHDVRWLASAVPAPAGREGHRIRVGAWNELEARFRVPWPVWGPGAFRELDALVAWADVVHVHDCLYAGSAAAIASAVLRRKPSLITQHIGHVPYGGVLDLVEGAAYRTLGRVVLEAASARVACSAHVPPFFASLGVRRRFELVPNGIDDRAFRQRSSAERDASRAASGLAPDAKVVLFAGRLVPKKGIAVVAQAQRELAREGIELVVAGDGPERGVLEGLPGARLLGSQPAARMPELYAMADALILPSRGEGLPLGVQEALLSGTPVVVSTDPSFTSNLGGLPGVTFVEDADAFAGAVRTALATPPPRDDIAAAAKALWGREKFVDRYERILRDLKAG
jgi:D-inositol-3-phosphate glycosyltransferase